MCIFNHHHHHQQQQQQQHHHHFVEDFIRKILNMRQWTKLEASGTGKASLFWRERVFGFLVFLIFVSFSVERGLVKHRLHFTPFSGHIVSADRTVRSSRRLAV